jgi:mannonate dehydratase
MQADQQQGEDAMINLEELPMRVGVGQYSELSDEYLAFAVQCGVKDVQLNTPRLPGTERWEYEDLKGLRERAESYGLRLICLENVPVSFYDKIMLGLPGRERQLENMIATIRNIGRAGIPIFGYHWMPNGVWRTDTAVPIRGGALSTAFDFEKVKDAPPSHGRVFTAEEMWANYDWYLERILPVCEEAGVHLALHPDDPPIPMLAGVARLFGSFEGFRRAMERHNSPMHGLDYCHGNWSAMRAGAGVMESIEWFGPQGRLLYVHLRDVQGGADNFTECFINEGNNNILEVVRALKRSGFKGFLLDDHVPRMVNDSAWGHRGRAYAIGYLMAMVEAVNAMD